MGYSENRLLRKQHTGKSSINLQIICSIKNLLFRSFLREILVHLRYHHVSTVTRTTHSEMSNNNSSWRTAQELSTAGTT